MSEQLIASLTKQVADLGAEAKNRRLKYKQAVAERDEARREREEIAAGFQVIEAERDKLKAAMEAAPNELQAEVDRLKGEITTRDHKAAFGKVAESQGVRSDAIDALWTVSKYEAKGEPNEAVLKERIGEAVKANPWSVTKAETATEAPAGAAATPPVSGRPGPGAGRSVETTTAPTAKTRIDADFAKSGRSDSFRIA